MTAFLIGGEKGGTGKSTIAYNLAIMAQMMGHDVLLLDTDKQASSSKFISNRNELELKPTPSCLQRIGKHLHNEIADLSKRYQTIIIDAGGQDSVELRSAMACPQVKKLYTPLSPSHFDLETLVTMDELIEMAASFNHNLEAYLIYNKAPTHTKVQLLDEAKKFCKDFENLTLCDAILSHRLPYQYSTGHHKSVVEFELERMKSLPSWQAKRYSPKASMEICNLYKQVFDEDFKGEITNFFETELKAVQG